MTTEDKIAVDKELREGLNTKNFKVYATGLDEGKMVAWPVPGFQWEAIAYSEDEDNFVSGKNVKPEDVRDRIPAISTEVKVFYVNTESGEPKEEFLCEVRAVIFGGNPTIHGVGTPVVADFWLKVAKDTKGEGYQHRTGRATEHDSLSKAQGALEAYFQEALSEACLRRFEGRMKEYAEFQMESSLMKGASNVA